MLGTILGDMIGSPWEHDAPRHTDFPLFTRWSRFTDHTVLTVATAHALLEGASYAEAYHEYGNRYPRAGYRKALLDWLASDDPQLYNSWGNGSTMRVSPVRISLLPSTT